METELENQPIQKRFQCRHILTSGQRCGSPSLRRENFCYYHLSTRRPIPAAPATNLEPFALPVLEDRDSIQLAISQVLARIASNELDPKRARLLIFGLQIAIRALPRESREPIQRTRGELARDENAANDLQDQMELDPALGLLAPLAEFVPPEDRSKSYVQRILDEIHTRKCPRCRETLPPESPEPEILPQIQAVAQPQNRVPHVRRIASTMGLLTNPTAESRPLKAVSRKLSSARPFAILRAKEVHHETQRSRPQPLLSSVVANAARASHQRQK